MGNEAPPVGVGFSSLCSFSPPSIIFTCTPGTVKNVPNWAIRCLFSGAEGEDKMTGVFLAMQFPHWLIVAGAILVVLGLVGLAFRQRLAPIGPRENRLVTTTAKGNNRTGKGRPPWETAAQNKRDDKKPTPTPGLTTGNDLRAVNEEIAELYEPKPTPRIEKP